MPPEVKPSAAIALACPVRGCGAALAREPSRLACPRGHAFDRARSGYFNLLQPHERRSARPGDAPEVLEARERSLAAGAGAALLELVAGRLARERASGAGRIGRGLRTLDAGCGTGWWLASLAARGVLEAQACCGVDLARAAVERGARRLPAATWIVANADRRLPLADVAADAVLTIDAHAHPAEFRRVLAPGGVWLAAVAGSGDLAELCRAALGEARPADRASALAAAAAAAGFALEERAVARHTARLERGALLDLLAATYRARAARAAALGEHAAMEVTHEHELLVLRRA